MKRGVVADYIRAHVKRPKQLPKPESFLRDNILRFYIREVCPMGMLKGATVCTPCEVQHFDPLPKDFTERKIQNFADWWDRQTNPFGAVNDLWGRDKT